MQLISSYVGNGLEEPARSWDQKNTRYIQIQRPKMVERYNENVHGVDLCDMMLSTYRIMQKSNIICIWSIIVLVFLSQIHGLYTADTWLNRTFPKSSNTHWFNFKA